jgi:hypothetical protein
MGLTAGKTVRPSNKYYYFFHTLHPPFQHIVQSWLQKYTCAHIMSIDKYAVAHFFFPLEGSRPQVRIDAVPTRHGLIPRTKTILAVLRMGGAVRHRLRRRGVQQRPAPATGRGMWSPYSPAQIIPPSGNARQRILPHCLKNDPWVDPLTDPNYGLTPLLETPIRA